MRLTISLIATFLIVSSALPAFAQGGYDTGSNYTPETDYDKDGSDGSQSGGGGPNERQPLPQMNDVQKWFSQYDEIRQRFEANPEERQYFDSLTTRRPGSGLSEEDQKFLRGLAERYSEAFNQMKEVEGINETSLLHRNYGSYLAQRANMYADYARILGEPNPVDRNGRPLASSMPDKRKYLSEIEKQNQMLDGRLRQAFNLSRNTYNPSEGEE